MSKSFDLEKFISGSTTNCNKQVSMTIDPRVERDLQTGKLYIRVNCCIPPEVDLDEFIEGNNVCVSSLEFSESFGDSELFNIIENEV